MPTIKIKEDGKWIDAISVISDADTLDGKHADAFALATELNELQDLVGKKSVADQVFTLEQKVSQVLNNYYTKNDIENKNFASETYVDEAIASIPTPNVSGQINVHNTSENAHMDIREAIPTNLSQLQSDDSHQLVSAEDKQRWDAKSNFSGNYNDLTNKPEIPSIEGLATENYVNEAIAAIPAPDVSGQISTHNTATNAHNDIRVLINGLTTRLNALADSDDTTLDQMSEIVAYIKNNKSLIDSITTNKVNVSDIINNLTTNVSNKPLSAAQGVALMGLIDALQEEFDGHTHAIADVSGLQSALDNLIIYVTLDDSTNKASMTSSEILAAVQSGADVIVDDGGIYSRFLVVDENNIAHFSSVHGGINETDDSAVHSIRVFDNAAFSHSIDLIPNISRVSHIVTPKQYGAKGDGVTDDTVAFQTALANNRVVHVTGGTYKLSGELVIRNNCCLELSQDTVLEFTQTSGNCISLMMLSSIKGNHATVNVPYAFTGNAVYMSTSLTTSVKDTPPFKQWSPMWKAGRYITDLNICKVDYRGFHYSVDGTCSGTGVYIHVDGNDTLTYMWGINTSGLRIAGAFSYGFRVLTEGHEGDSGWNHEIRAEGFIDGAEVGVSFEDTKNAYLSFIVQPRRAYTPEGVYFPYAKWGIYLKNAQNMDLSGSRVWDWDSEKSLWREGNINQHLVMIGNCSGAILNEWYYYAKPDYDIRSLIYTDTPSNLEKMTILQEPFTRWFKPKDNSPYFYDGEFEKRLILKEEFDECIQTEKVANFTNILPSSINKDGNLFNNVGYVKSGVRWNADGSMTETEYYGCTGLIPINYGDTIYVKSMYLGDGTDTIPCAVVFDANYNQLVSGNAEQLINNVNTYHFYYFDTNDGFALQVKAPSNAAYVAFTFKRALIGNNPIVSKNSPIDYSLSGHLTNVIKVKAKDIDGLSEMFDEIAYVETTENFTNALATAIDTDGSIFNGIGYIKNGYALNTDGSMSESTYSGCTGFIPVKQNDVLYVQGMNLSNDNYGFPVLISYDSSFAYMTHRTGKNVAVSDYFFDYEEIDDGFKLTIKQRSTVAYVRFSYSSQIIEDNPIVSINNPITYTTNKMLHEDIKVNAENINGLSEILGSYIDDVDALLGGV